MIADLPAVVGTLTVRSQADAIALERSIRAHLFAWLEGLETFDRPNLRHPRVRAAEQAVREAEYREDWAGVERGWTSWLAAIREVTP